MSLLSPASTNFTPCWMDTLHSWILATIMSPRLDPIRAFIDPDPLRPWIHRDVWINDRETCRSLTLLSPVNTRQGQWVLMFEILLNFTFDI